MTEVQTDNVDAFFEKPNQAADVVTQKLVAVAPEAAETMLSLVQAKGVFDLAMGIAFLIIMALLAKSGVAKFKKAFQEDEEVYAMIGTILFIGAFISFLKSSFRIFIFYNWVAAFYPEGAIAMKALEAVGITL